MIRSLCLFLLCTSPALAEADMFERLRGIYGDPHSAHESCKGVVQHLVFTSRNQTGVIEVWEDQEGPSDPFVALALPFTVLGVTERGVEVLFEEMRLVGDAENASDGPAETWELRALSAPERFCRHRMDWPDERCIDAVQRCEEEVPLS